MPTGKDTLKKHAAKNFVVRKAHTIASGKAQGTHRNRIKCKEHLRNRPEAVIGQEQSTFIQEFGNPLRIPCSSYTAWT
jgi:hypothetical protein